MIMMSTQLILMIRDTHSDNNMIPRTAESLSKTHTISDEDLFEMTTYNCLVGITNLTEF